MVRTFDSKELDFRDLEGEFAMAFPTHTAITSESENDGGI